MLHQATEQLLFRILHDLWSNRLWRKKYRMCLTSQGCAVSLERIHVPSFEEWVIWKFYNQEYKTIVCFDTLKVSSDGDVLMLGDLRLICFLRRDQ